MKRNQKSFKEEGKGIKTEEMEEDEERWPSPMDPLEYDSDRDSPNKSLPVVPPPPGMDEQTEEEKKYIQEKIQQANRELQDQEAPDMTRRRRLHFKEKLVDLVVPPLQFEKDGREAEGEQSNDRNKDSETETEVSGKLSKLKLSPREEKIQPEGCAGEQVVKEGRVLVERDGKFDLVSLKEVESQGLLPPIICSDYSRSLSQIESTRKIPQSSSSPLQQGSFNQPHAPKPPAQPRSRPSSANHSHRGRGRGNNSSSSSKRRVQSATGTTCQATYTLSPQQKELLQRVQERRERLTREVRRQMSPN